MLKLFTVVQINYRVITHTFLLVTCHGGLDDPMSPFTSFFFSENLDNRRSWITSLHIYENFFPTWKSVYFSGFVVGQMWFWITALCILNPMSSEWVFSVFHTSSQQQQIPINAKIDWVHELQLVLLLLIRVVQCTLPFSDHVCVWYWIVPEIGRPAVVVGNVDKRSEAESLKEPNTQILG